MFHTAITVNDLVFMLNGAVNTLAITCLAMLGGTILGGVFGVARAISPWWINIVIGAFLDLFRSVPLLIQLILANSFKSIVGLKIDAFAVSCVILSVYASSYCAEIVRAGYLSVPTVTRRAARSLGLTYWQELREIVFPLALRVVLPSWIGLSLGVMKDTSLVLWIGVFELLKSSQIIVTRIQEPLFVLLIVGFMYFLISYPIGRFGHFLEQRWREDN